MTQLLVVALLRHIILQSHHSYLSKTVVFPSFISVSCHFTFRAHWFNEPKLCFFRAHSFASAKAATLESPVRSLTPAITDHVTTTALVSTLDRGVMDTNSHAPAFQVCVSEFLSSTQQECVSLCFRISLNMTSETKATELLILSDLF